MARDRVRASHSVMRIAHLVLVLALACFGVLASEAVAVAPPNDDFGHATPIRVGSTVKGTIDGATKQPAEPQHARSRATHSVWYRFRARRNVTVGLNTCRSSFNTVVAVYRGRSLQSLRTVDFNDNGGCLDGSRVAFTAWRGRSYRIAVAGIGVRGRFRLKVAAIATPPNDDFINAVPIRLGSTVSGTTDKATLELGEPPHLLDAHTVWFRFRVREATEVRLDACNGIPPDLLVYRGARVSRLTRANEFGGCVVRFAARPAVTYHVVAGGHLTTGRFRLRARTAKPPPNDDFAAATPIALETSIQATTRDSSRQRGEPVYYYTPFSVWFRLTLSEPTTVALTACANVSSVNLYVYRGDQLNQLTPVGSRGACLWQFELQPGVYSIQAEGTPAEADFTLSAEAVRPPP